MTDPPPGFPRVLPHHIYEDVDAAIAWLTEVFGFRERMEAHHQEADGTTSRAQIEVADSLITIGRPSVHADSPRRGVSTMLYGTWAAHGGGWSIGAGRHRIWRPEGCWPRACKATAKFRPGTSANRS